MVEKEKGYWNFLVNMHFDLFAYFATVKQSMPWSNWPPIKYHQTVRIVADYHIINSQASIDSCKYPYSKNKEATTFLVNHLFHYML